MKTKNKKKKILFGAVDIGFRIAHYSKFIEEYFSDKLEAESFSKYVLPKDHFKTSYTYEYPIDKLPAYKMYFFSFRFFIYSLFKYDVFHFFSGETLLTRKLRPFELWTYKLFGKKIIMHFVGADIRSEKYLEEKRNDLTPYLKGQQLQNNLSEPYQQKLIEDARKYSDKIIVSTPDLLQIIPEADYVPVFLNFNDINTDADNSQMLSGKIKILHSPSGFTTKGSEYIHEVLKSIQKKFDNIEIIIPFDENRSTKKAYALTRYELLETLGKTDIVIDQMLIGWYGLKSIEALSKGCEVICFIEEELKQYLFEDTPIYSASILTLEKKLEEVIHKIQLDNNRNQRQKNNLSWIHLHHDITAYKDYFQHLWVN